MANIATGNPIHIDTAGTIWTGTKYVRLFQWVDDNEDLADGDMCQFTVNGVQLEAEVQVEVTANHGLLGPVIWQIGPFDKGLPWSNLVVDVLDHGDIHIWLE